MKSLSLILCVGVLSLSGLASAQNPSPAQRPTPAKSSAQVSFGGLKELAGGWAGTITSDPHNPDIEGPIQVTMSVASGGNALVHEISPGGMPEPTMIYVEDDRLTLVHYCEAGNRPRLVARKSLDGKTVEFEFVDISGNTMPVYLSHFVFTVIDANHHTEDWTFALPGDKLLRAHFDLRRTKKSAPLPAEK